MTSGTVKQKWLELEGHGGFLCTVSIEVKGNFCPEPTCYYDPLWHLHRCVHGQGLLKRQWSRQLICGHHEGLGDPHALADTLCVLQIILDAIHLGHLSRGGGEGWPTHPACRDVKYSKTLKILHSLYSLIIKAHMNNSIMTAASVYHLPLSAFQITMHFSNWS